MANSWIERKYFAEKWVSTILSRRLRLGTACAALIHEGVYGVMIAARGEKAEPVPLDQVVGKIRTVPLDHPWIESARYVGTSLGD